MEIPVGGVAAIFSFISCRMNDFARLEPEARVSIIFSVIWRFARSNRCGRLRQINSSKRRLCNTLARPHRFIILSKNKQKYFKKENNLNL